MRGGEDHARDRERRQPGLSPGLDAAMLRSRTAAWRRLEESTRDRMAAKLAGWPDCWCEWSGGKDSTTMAHMAHQVRPGIPMVHFDSGLDFPENIAYMDSRAERYGWNLQRIRCGDGVAAMKAAGTWAHDDPDPAAGVSAALDEYWRVITAAPSAEAQRRFGGHVLIGLRRDESAKRAVSLSRAAGHATLAGGLRSWAPIGHWRTADVWAYLSARQIPENPVYTRLREMGAPERQLRVGFAAGAEAVQFGRIMWLKRGWPDLYERYAEVLPRLREFA